MEDGKTPPTNRRRGMPGCLLVFVGLFALVFAVVFSVLGWKFVDGVINQNTNSHELVIRVEDKDIVTSNTRNRTSTTHFVVEATVLSENGQRELFNIAGGATEAQSLYTLFVEGEEYTVSVNGDPEKFRVITGIIE